MADKNLAVLAVVQRLANEVLQLKKIKRGPKGEKGDKGERGSDGLVGPKGDTGERGLNGQDGKDGKDGRDGKDGKDGIEGRDGKDGVSVHTAYLAADGDLVFTMSDGSEIAVNLPVLGDNYYQSHTTVRIGDTGGGGDGGTPAPVVGDIYWNKTESYLDFENGFIDAQEVEWSQAGTPVIGTDWATDGSSSCLFADGNRRISRTLTADQRLTFQDFTVELSLKKTALEADYTVIFSTAPDVQSYGALVIAERNGDLRVTLSEDGTTWTHRVDFLDEMVVDQVYEIAVARRDTEVYVYIDGIVRETFTGVGTLTENTAMYVGGGISLAVPTDRAARAYIDRFRYTVGATRYDDTGYTVATGDYLKVMDEVAGRRSYNVKTDLQAANVVSQLDVGQMTPGNYTPDNIEGEDWTPFVDPGQQLVTDNLITFGGAGNYIRHTDSVAFRNEFNGVSSTNWTIEMRIIPQNMAAASTVLDWRPVLDSKGLALIAADSGNPTKISLFLGDSTGGWDATLVSVDDLVDDTEYEIAITRNGNDYYMHLNGAYQAKATTSAALNLGSGGLYVGAARGFPGADGDFALLRMRMTKDISRYVENVDYVPEGT